MPGREQVLQVVVRALTPLVGATMARASTEGLCTKLGLTAARIEPADAERLVVAIEPGLNVFVGRMKTRAVLDELRRAITALGEAT